MRGHLKSRSPQIRPTELVPVPVENALVF